MARKLWFMTKKPRETDPVEPPLYLAEWRIFCGFEQTQVADLFLSHGWGTTEASISRYESGDQAVSLKVLGRFATIYGVKPKNLMDPPPPPGTDIADWRLVQLHEESRELLDRKLKPAKK